MHEKASLAPVLNLQMIEFCLRQNLVGAANEEAKCSSDCRWLFARSNPFLHGVRRLSGQLTPKALYSTAQGRERSERTLGTGPTLAIYAESVEQDRAA